MLSKESMFLEIEFSLLFFFEKQYFVEMMKT